ncbi:hypothetical protein QF001_000385 [Paraburkholderia youngii]
MASNKDAVAIFPRPLASYRGSTAQAVDPIY